MDAERVDSTQALGLDQIALNAGHDCPDVTEGDAGKTEAPQQRHWDAKDGRQHTVAPVLGDGEGGVAGLPHSIHTVGAIRLGYHILKIHLELFFFFKEGDNICWLVQISKNQRFVAKTCLVYCANKSHCQ